MTDTPQSITLSHKIGWDLRAIAITMGCVAVALPFFVDDGAMGRGQSLLWMAGGLAVIAVFALVKSTVITADGEGLTVRRSGLFGKSMEKLPASAIMRVEVMGVSTREGGSRFCVAVKLKGRRQLFMGESHGDQADAEAEAALFHGVAGMESCSV